ncbi:hypothetical protein [Asanoa sp. NPDC050611]|uniref:hypothetical protein n=1 Tax=Asanoa sp. NPDC050611 TaxID=3157098 RepID=UPI0033D86D6A
MAALFGVGFGVPFGLRAGPFVGLAVGACFAGMAFVIVGASVAHALSPAATLRDDRRYTLTMALSSTGTAAVLGPAAGVTAGLCGAVMVAAAGEWLPFCFYRAWSALTGDSPWRPMSFLHDAHLRGVLQQSGGPTGFRHAALRRHLTSSAVGRQSGDRVVAVRLPGHGSAA